MAGELDLLGFPVRMKDGEVWLIEQAHSRKGPWTPRYVRAFATRGDARWYLRKYDRLSLGLMFLRIRKWRRV